MSRMKVSCCVASAAVLIALPVIGFAAKDDLGCNDVNFSEEILKQLPKVRDACQDVKIKNDKVYAHFVGEVMSRSPVETPPPNFCDCRCLVVSAGVHRTREFAG